MNDAIVLLSISQIVCLGGLAYLYMQLQGMSSRAPRRRPVESMRAQPIAQPVQVAPERRPLPAVVTRPQPAPVFAQANVPVSARMAELGVDVATMARRMNKSEEEVRLMLRRQALRQ